MLVQRPGQSGNDGSEVQTCFVQSIALEKRMRAKEWTKKWSGLCASLRWHYPGQVRRVFSHPKTFNSSGPLAWPNGNTKEEARGMAFLPQVAANFADLNRGQQYSPLSMQKRLQLLRIREIGDARLFDLLGDHRFALADARNAGGHRNRVTGREAQVKRPVQ